MVPQDAVQKNLYGYEGYFLRFVNYNRENPEYVLPQVKGIYPNMARVVNVNTVTEEFYLDDMDNALQIQLSQQNLLKVRVEVQEETHQGLQWIEWKQGRHSYEGGRTYQIDMEAGLLSFRKHAFAEYHLQRMVRRSGYRTAITMEVRQMYRRTVLQLREQQSAICQP